MIIAVINKFCRDSSRKVIKKYFVAWARAQKFMKKKFLKIERFVQVHELYGEFLHHFLPILILYLRIKIGCFFGVGSCAVRMWWEKSDDGKKRAKQHDHAKKECVEEIELNNFFLL